MSDIKTDLGGDTRQGREFWHTLGLGRAEPKVIGTTLEFSLLQDSEAS